MLSRFELCHFATLSSDFFIIAVSRFGDQTLTEPLFVPSEGRSRRYATQLCLGDEKLMRVLVGELAEEELLLAGGGDGWDEFGAIAGNELVG